MVFRGEPNLRFKFHTICITNNQQKSMPRETEKHSLMMTGGKQISGQRPGGRNQDGHGMTKSEDFFVSGFRTHVVAATVCATGGVHTLRVARTFFWHSFFA